MRVSQFFLSTLKEAPSEAELVSHKLMLRAGLTRRLGSGLYTWMPLGLRVLRRVEAIVRARAQVAGVGGEVVGHVTSSWDSPLLGRAVLLGWQKRLPHADVVEIDGREARVSQLPFYDKDGARARL